MAGFKKAKAEQAALKYGIYGLAGSGKTLTALMMAEGLAKREGKRIAYVDTEHGTDFYAKRVPERTVHPEAFDFDALYSRSITEIRDNIFGLDPAVHGIVVVDSQTHLWEAAKAAYNGKLTKIGTIPITAWGKIKKPYKEIVDYLMNSTMHVILCGREGKEMETDEDTDEMKVVGSKMKAESETPFEPHILIRMERLRRSDGQDAAVSAFVEKDRSGVLGLKTIFNPNFESLCAPILPLLGSTQAQIPDEATTTAKDAEALADEDNKKEANSAAQLRTFIAKFDLANTTDEVEAVSKEITPAIKKTMLAEHTSQLREKYHERITATKGR